MSLKAVELQVALSRTQEISRIHEQQMHRNAHEQQALIEDRKQLDQLTRQRPDNIQESTSGQIKEKQDKNKKRKEGQQEAAAESNQQKKKEPPQASKQMSDPLRGHFIDISL